MDNLHELPAVVEDLMDDEGMESEGEDWDGAPVGHDVNGTPIFGLDPGLPTSEKLRWWYAQAPSEYTDLISQLGGSSGTFLIHAESLILRFALDKDYRTEFIESPQFLRLIFTIEKFLHALQQCGGRFRLVFLDNYKRLLQKHGSSLWTVRQCLLLTCQTSQQHVDFVVFKSWVCPEFNYHLSHRQPPFILIDDCSDLPLSTNDDDDDELGNETAANDNNLLLVYPYAFMLHCSVRQIHVASFFDLERRGRKVHAFVFYPQTAAIGSLDAEATALIRQQDYQITHDEQEKKSEAFKELLKSWTTVPFTPDNVGLREFIIAQFIKENTEVDETDPDAEEDLERAVYFGKILLIASQVARRLPLSHRCFVGFEGVESWGFNDVASSMIEFYLSEASSTLDTIISHCPRETDDSPDELFCQLLAIGGNAGLIGRTVADLVDYKLLMAVLILVTQTAESSKWTVSDDFFKLPDDTRDEMNQLLFSVVGIKEPMFPFCVTKLVESLKGSTDIKAIDVMATPQPRLLPIQDDFVQRLLGVECCKDFEFGNLPFTVAVPEDPSIGNKFWGSWGENLLEGFLVDVAVREIEEHRVNDLKNLTVNEDSINKKYKTEIERAEARRRQQLRQQQRGAYTVHKFAMSLAGLSDYHHRIFVDKLGSHVWKVDEMMQLEANAKYDAAVRASVSVADRKTKGSAKDVARVSKKAEEIIRKNEEAQKQKAKSLDDEKLPILEKTIAMIGRKAGNPKEFLNKILNVLSGQQRSTEELGNFKGIISSLKLSESQLKALMQVANVFYSCLTLDFGAAHRDPDSAVALHKLVCLTFEFVHRVCLLYKGYITEEGIQMLQKLLCTLGFAGSAKCLFDDWIEQKVKDAESEIPQQVANKPAKKGARPPKEIPSAKVEAAARKTRSAFQNSFVCSTSLRKVEFAVPEDYEADVQLKFMGHQMERTLGSSADPRVKFYPDKWQTRLLDAIDERRSALVCAPTGCGKTFICYYAMEKTLSYDDHSVIVYVCPSKALVDQVFFEVEARFGSKEYSSDSQQKICGKMLREHHQNATNCQILLTLPSLLEMMLMSPHYRDWVSRLRYVILDEIHCIGEGDDEGRAWERLVQLMPCPFLALSATVGNPESFHHWLGDAHVSSESRRHDNKPAVEIIRFNERYADLSTCVFSPDVELDPREVAAQLGIPHQSSQTTPETSMDAESTAASSTVNTECQFRKNIPIAGGLFALNPFVCLTHRQVLLEGITSDFYVTSRDLLRVYYTLRRSLFDYYSANSTLNPEQQAELDLYHQISPKNYFVNTAAITKRQYRYYLETFKAILISLTRNGIVSEPVFNEFVKRLGTGRPLTTAASIMDGTIWNPSVDEGAKIPVELTLQSQAPVDTGYNLNLILGRNQVAESYKDARLLLRFVKTLYALGLLPSLMFNFSRSVVTHLCCSLVTALKNGQYDKYYGTPEATQRTKAINKQRMDKYKEKVKRRDVLMKMKTLDREQREEQGISNKDLEAELEEPLPPPPGDIADEYDEEFNFCDRRSWQTQSDEISKIIDNLRRAKPGKENLNPLYLDAIELGIGLHHSGLPRRYRTAVESLFRKGFLRVVFSTETLSLGINMPCKATVFIGDSLQLSPLMYRQTSGRAGRRGFDRFGHVIFWEVPFLKLQRLACAKLPVLSGEFPITPTLVLRSFQLLNSVKAKQALALAKPPPKSSVLKEKIPKEQENELEKALMRLYQKPLFSVSSSNSREGVDEAVQLRWAIRYSFRFAVDILRRSQLLDTEANCQGLAGLYNVLYEREPSNNTLNWLMLSGVLHEWLNTCNADSASDIYPSWPRKLDVEPMNPGWKLSRLITLLAFCLCRVKLNYNVFVNMQIRPGVNPLLPKLPSKLIKTIEQQNHLAFENAVGYVQALSFYLATTVDSEYLLPFTGVNFNIGDCSEMTTEGSLCGKLSKMMFKAVARSPFAAIAGRRDSDFKTAEELCHSVRQAVYFDKSMVPQVTTKMVNYNGVNLPLLSSYVLDFFTYGKLSHTVTHSAIDRNVLWYALETFITTAENMHSYMEQSISKAASVRGPVQRCDFLENILGEATCILRSLTKLEAA